MKNVKRAILGIGILSAGLLSAQSAEMNNMLKIGGNVGIAAPSTNASANLGLDIAYQHLVTPGFGLGIVFLPIIFLPMLAFGKSEYQHIENQ